MQSGSESFTLSHISYVTINFKVTSSQFYDGSTLVESGSMKKKNETFGIVLKK